ncbi:MULTISPECIES: hypothetical protein [Bradyrhizobium]|uniref:hypothetical protein n=1 Tax=Bradyrhizobium elkanii TaxID=29448 RepID=UPI000400C6B0|nr:hypothetical protein [Bradyrhizobium elkanii]
MAPGLITPEDAEIYILSMIDETPSSDALSLAAAATIAGITSSAEPRLQTLTAFDRFSVRA